MAKEFNIKNWQKKYLNEQSFDDRLAQQMGMSSDEFEDEIASRDIGSPFPGTNDKSSGKALADRTIEHFRSEHYKGMSDKDLDDFSVEMIKHFLDNVAAKDYAKRNLNTTTSRLNTL